MRHTVAAWVLVGCGGAWPGAAFCQSASDAVQSPGLEQRKPVIFAADVFFDVDSTALAPAAQRKLDILSEQIQQLDLRAVYVTGHADALASGPHNLRLSAVRSVVVRRYLIDKGIAESRVHIAARGERQPVADNHTDQGRSHNRRVEIEVIGMRR